MFDKLALRFINWYLEKNNNKIVYSRISPDTGKEYKYVVRRFTKSYYENTLGIKAGKIKYKI